MMQNNIKIAITGGIGSGKSTVSRIISDIGFPVFSCDKIYADLLNEASFISMLSEDFADAFENGCINKSKLAALVFSDKRKLKRLNRITHPIIMNRVFALMSNYKICFCEVPLLFESGYEKNFDYVLVVLRNIDERTQSVAQRDNLKEQEVIKRIKTQIDYDNYDFAQYYVIHNNCDFEHLRIQVQNFLDKYMR